MSDVLAFAGVTVRRGANTLLDDVTWDVEEGQRWVILGPNGAGKTTLLQIAATRMHPTSGVAGILGEVLGTVDVFELRPRIGFASAALAERIPRGELVRDVVVTASYGQIGRWRERYESSTTTGRANCSRPSAPPTCATGPSARCRRGRKRVQIARALMTDPELLLLDEPAAGLDLGGREDLVARLSAIAADIYAPALVLVTHHVEEIPPNFTDVLLLREGRIVAQGPIEVTLTAENLSATFGMPLELNRHGDRFSARAHQGGDHGMA